ncbi:MAG: hypothetical protein KBT07_06790 [Clostridiales bacterium]|nr:hypothetical protein [Candidatus Scatonaster coprocaballi]
MSGKATSELASIRDEIQNEIKQLKQIQSSIKKELSGIGGEKASASIDDAITQYSKAIIYIDKLKPLAKEIDERNSGMSSGGGFGGGGGGGHAI